MTSAILHSSTIGDHLHRIARAIVPMIALAYVAGLALGNWVHWLNDRLVGRGRRQWAASARPRPVALLQPSAVIWGAATTDGQLLAAVPATSAPQPLESLRVLDLRRLACSRGIPRAQYVSARKAHLLDLLRDG
jgi:hypothetical protein